MTDLNDEQKAAVRSVLSSEAIVKAKAHEHEAACHTCIASKIVAAREAYHAALDAWLDARERLYESDRKVSGR